ncbi:lasso peptide biosynthesis PqqD family chaperone [Streptomyces mayteni]
MTSPPPAPRIRLRHDVTTCETDAGMALLDERSGRYWQLNTAGAHVLRQLLDGTTPEDLADQLATTRNVTRARVAADIDTLLDQLAAARLTEPGPTTRRAPR